MGKDFRLASNGKPSDGSRKGSKAHFEELLNLTNMSSWQGAGSEALGEDICMAEVTEVVKKLHLALGVDEIRP